MGNQWSIFQPAILICHIRDLVEAPATVPAVASAHPAPVATASVPAAVGLPSTARVDEGTQSWGSMRFFFFVRTYTTLKFNMDPKKWWLEDDAFPLGR